MNSHLTPEMVAIIYQHTVLAVSILLAGGGIGFSIGSGIVCGDTIECMVRQPDTRPTLMLDTFIFTGLVGNFPFIILAFGAWFLFANPFIDTLKSTLHMESASLEAPAVPPAKPLSTLTPPQVQSNSVAVAKVQSLAVAVTHSAKPTVESVAVVKPVVETAAPAKSIVEVVKPAQPPATVTH